MKRFFWITIGIIGMMLLGCSKSEIFVEYPEWAHSGGSSTDSTVNNQNSSLLSFSAMVESLNLTRSSTPLPKGIRATIFAYDSATVNLTTSGSYLSTSLGTLSGVDGYKMYLPNGAYDIYAVSTNEALLPPTFTGMTSSPLSNGIDYLWWEVQNQEVYSSTLNLNIIFTHKACQVVFKLSTSDGIKLDSLVSIYTTAPTEGSTMNLSTGVITPATSQQTGFVNEMGLNGNIAQSILLPTDNWNYMGVIIRAFVNGESNSRYFGGQVPIPNKTLAAGNSYQFSLILNASDVSTSSVSVAAWTIVDDNVPIYTPEL